MAVFNTALSASQINDIMGGDFSAFSTVEPLPVARIDFGETGHTLQGGFIREEGANNSGVTSVTVAVPNEFGGVPSTMNVIVSELDATTHGLEHRERNSVTGTSVNNMLSDLIATRDNQLSVTFEDLAPGNYEFTSYHNDSTANGFENGSFFDVFLNGDLIVSNVDASNVWGDIDLSDVAMANFQFTHLMEGDVTIDFTGTAANTNGFIPLSGLELIQTGLISTIPEPSTFALAAIGLLGLAWLGRRRKVA